MPTSAPALEPVARDKRRPVRRGPVAGHAAARITRRLPGLSAALCPAARYDAPWQRCALRDPARAHDHLDNLLLVGTPAPFLRTFASLPQRAPPHPLWLPKHPRGAAAHARPAVPSSAHSAPGVRPVPAIAWGCRPAVETACLRILLPSQQVCRMAILSCRSHTRSRRAGQVADGVLSPLHFLVKSASVVVAVPTGA